MVYCTDCGKTVPCGCDKDIPQPTAENKMVDSKKGTGKASKQIVEK